VNVAIQESSSVGGVYQERDEKLQKTKYFPYVVVQIIIQEIFALLPPPIMGRVYLPTPTHIKFG
jgi:hypothetical protein